MMQFDDDVLPVTRSRAKSNSLMFLHFVASYLVGLVDVPAFIVTVYVLGPLVHRHVGEFTSASSDFAVGCLADSAILVPAFMLMLFVSVVSSRRLLCQSFRGQHAPDSWLFVQFVYFTKVMRAADMLLFRNLNGTPFMPLTYRLMGGRVDSTALLFFRHCADFDMLTVAKDAIISFDSYLELHQKTSTELVFEPIKIGAAAVVGARGALMLGTSLSSQSLVSTSSIVLPGEEVRSKNVVGMNPARVVYQVEFVRERLEARRCLMKRCRGSCRFAARGAARCWSTRM